MKAEKINSIAILIIALTAVVVSIWQINLMRHHNRLTVQPFIKLYNERNGDEIEFYIQNKGEGAAIIKSFNLKVDGKIYTNWADAIAALDSTFQIPQSAGIGNGTIISKGENHLMCTIKKTQSDFNFSIGVSIEFESLYNEPDSTSVTMSHTNKER
jgi:hypothetical protein